MEKRLKGMKRIVALQTQMRRREEWRLANIEREDAALVEREAQLVAFMDADSGVASLMVDATVRRIRAVTEQRSRLVPQKEAQKARLLAQQQRVGCAERLHHEIDIAVQRMLEDRDLDAVLEASIGQGKTSLP
jgi:hypothetical protein